MARGETPVWWLPQGVNFGAGVQAAPKPELGKSYSGDTGGGPAKPKDQMALLLEKIQALYDELNMPFDPNSPEFAPILNAMRQNTLSSSQMAGVYGPYSQNQAEQAYARGAAQLGSQRKGQALQTLGLLAGTTGAQYDRQYQHDLDKWQQQTQKDTDLWRLGGGAVGGLAGGIGGFLLGGPAGAAAGAAGGWNLGSNVGGAIGGIAQKPLPNMPMTFGGY